MKLIIIAFRNLNRQKKRSFLLGGAISFGILIVTIINGFTGSFVNNVSENFSNIFAGHIFIQGIEKDEEGKTIDIIRDDSVLKNAVDDLEIPYRYLTRRSEFRGTLMFQGESVSQTVVGTDWGDESLLKDRMVLVQGSFENLISDPRGIIISDKIAEILKVEIGDRIIVRLRTVTGQQNVGEFNLAAVSYDPGLLGSLSVYGNLCYVNELLAIDCDEYMTFGLLLEKLSEIDKYADPLFDKLDSLLSMFPRKADTGDDRNPVMAMFDQADEEEWEGTRYRFFTLNEALSEADQIVRILNTTGLVILLILFFIIMVGITNTFRMIMIERIKEIGTMRALGMQKGGVRNLFLLEAVLLSLGGALGGLILAGIAMFVLSRIFWGLDSPIFILLDNGYMTFRLVPLQVLLHFGIVSILTVVAALIPARKAAAMPPVDALRAK
ncbi:MAG: FtsX-like permease family protein [Spirochaetales bacterium]|jgi:putative ABC transport system permease protein|nr:FtsX-like permease family protein [Spirochaetales bacterium]